MQSLERLPQHRYFSKKLEYAAHLSLELQFERGNEFIRSMKASILANLMEVCQISKNTLIKEKLRIQRKTGERTLYRSIPFQTLQTSLCHKVQDKHALILEKIYPYRISNSYPSKFYIQYPTSTNSCLGSIKESTYLPTRIEITSEGNFAQFGSKRYWVISYYEITLLLTPLVTFKLLNNYLVVYHKRDEGKDIINCWYFKQSLGFSVKPIKGKIIKGELLLNTNTKLK